MAIKKYLIKYNDGASVVHWDGVFQPGDMSLCSSDLMGDSLDGKEGWQPAIQTNKKVNCVQCLRIVEQVKQIIKQTK